MVDRHVARTFLDLVDGLGGSQGYAHRDPCRGCQQADELRLAFEQEFDQAMRSMAPQPLPAGTVLAPAAKVSRRVLPALGLAGVVTALLVGAVVALGPHSSPTGSETWPYRSDQPALVVPAEVSSRELLPWCGHEVRWTGDVMPGSSPTPIDQNVRIRSCFIEAQEAGEPAEYVLDHIWPDDYLGPAGPHRTLYRALPGGRIEIVTSMVADKLALRRWTSAECGSIVHVDRDDDGVPHITGFGVCPDPGTHPVIETEASPDEQVLAEQLVRFARTGSADALASMPLADEVALYLNSELMVVSPRANLTEADAWELHPGPLPFAQRTSALSVLAEANTESDGEPVIREIRLNVEPDERCGMPPRDYDDLPSPVRRLTLQPVTSRGCVDLWAVDLFLEGGRVIAVALETPSGNGE